MINADCIITIAMLIAAGLCGFVLHAATGSQNKLLRSVGWFIPGLLVGVLLTAALFAMTDI